MRSGTCTGAVWSTFRFRVRVRKELVAAGEARLHHVLPQTGWVSYLIRSEEDVEGALERFCLNYDRLTARNKEGA